MKGCIFRMLMSFSCISVLATAAGGQENVRNLFFNELNQRNGLSSLSNMYLSRDSRGYVWFGGFNGLFRFDGKTAKFYPTVLEDGSRDISISSRMFEDKQGRLWFTTYGAIHCLDPRKDEPEPIPLKDSCDVPLSQHYAFHLDSNDCLWTVAGKKLHLFNVFTRKDTVLHFFDTFIAYSVENEKGVVEAVAVPLPDSPVGIELFDYTGGKSVLKKSYFKPNDPRGLPPARVLFLQTEGDSVLWLPTDRGIIRFPWRRPSDYKTISAAARVNNPDFWEVALWKENYIWATSSNAGVHLFSKNGLTHENISTIWINNHPTDISKAHNLFLDTDENLWISCWDKGIYFTNLRQSKFSHVLKPSPATGSRNRSIVSISQDNKGHLWCLSQEEGLFELNDRGTVLNHYEFIVPINDGKSTGRLSHIYSDAEGDTWISAGRNLYLRDAKQNHFALIGKNLDGFSNVIQIAPNRFLLLTLTKLIDFQKTTKTIDFQKIKPLKKWDRLYQMYWDEGNLLFIADSFDKLMVYQIGEGTIDSLTEIRNAGTVYGLANDFKSGTIWLATDQGLMKLQRNNPGILIPVIDKGKILNGPLKSVLKDNSGNLWLSSNTGIFKYDTQTNSVKHYTESDGLQGLQFLPGSGCTLSDGRLAFGGVNGLNIFDPEKVTDNPTEPIVHITEIIVNDTGPLPGVNPFALESWTFPFEQRNLSFRFIAIEYSAPEENTFAYQLAGYDFDTVYAGTNGFARYNKLPSGQYTLKVWAANSDGVWTKTPRELEIVIRPHWTNTWPFILSVAILITVIAWLIIRYRIAQIREKAELNTRIAENKMAALRSQMNPHFVFNSLQTVNGLITRQDLRGAIEYVNQFARLMRVILENSREGLIPLEREIELLELYMKIEARRFSTPFTYKITTGEEVDTYNMEIPSMLLQPFVENAIKHGLFHKKEAGHINIAFLKENGSLKCVVEDNGVGRKKTAELNAQHGRAHKSRGLEIVKERLAIIRNSHPGEYGVKINDLMDREQNPTGTRVEILLPVDG